jgi:hypothetical protein
MCRFALVQQVIELGAFPQAYGAQTRSAASRIFHYAPLIISFPYSMSGFVICDAQLTLLKFLDGHLNLPANTSKPATHALEPFLLETLASLSSDLLSEARTRDARDASTFQGVVLVLLCLSSIGLGSDEGRAALIAGVDHTVCMSSFSWSLPWQASIDLSNSPSTVQRHSGRTSARRSRLLVGRTRGGRSTQEDLHSLSRHRQL